MKHKSEDLKTAAVLHFQEVSHSRKETSRVFRCSPRSLNRWIDRYTSTGRIIRHNRLAVAYKVTNAHVTFAKQSISEDKTVSMKELQTIMINKFPGLTVTLQHIGAVVRDLNLTRKRTRHGHFPKKRYNRPIDRRTESTAFYTVTNAHPIDKIISIDETSLSPFMFRRYGRCEIGDKCILSTSNNKVFTKHTFIAGITNSGIIGWKLYDQGGSNTIRFAAFLTNLINRNHLRGYLFLMDNASAHKNDTIHNLITNSGNTIQYIVPYSPQMNCIENWFSQFKYYMSTSKVRTVAEMRADIRTTITMINIQNYQNYFNYAYRREAYQNRPRPRNSTRKRKLKMYKQN
jgi:transposase